MKPHYLIDQEITPSTSEKGAILKERKARLHISKERKSQLLEKRKVYAEEYQVKKELKNKLTHEQLSELHNTLVQTCIDFINKYDIGDIEELDFHVDSLQMSAEHGSWQPCTDSSLVASEEVPDENYYFIRKELDYSI